jgi:hypothetical protein
LAWHADVPASATEGPVRRIEGEIEELRCGSCGVQSATFVFTGDTDMTTMDLETATAPETGEVVIGERLGNETREQFAERISRERGAKFATVPLIRTEDTNEPTSDFRVFLRAYRPPTPVFGCPKCGGEARVIRRESPAEYIARGGQITAPQGWISGGA